MIHCNRVRGKPLIGIRRKRIEAEMNRIMVFLIACMLLLSGCQSAVPKPQPEEKWTDRKT